TMEMDFYTAVDDLKPDDTSGAGMMGFTGFDSATFYRYMRLDWDQLLSNLGGNAKLARKTVEAFLRAVVEAVPSGKQNSFAAHNPPSLMVATVREGSFAWSLANAFEKPVWPQRNSGLVAPSVEKLDSYWGRLVQTYGDRSLVRIAALALESDLPLDALRPAVVESLDAWVTAVMEALPIGEA
ncbi:MAG: type I-E CRISPR-associated protein Cas7/Cse4/CasC, partial [Anaerolineae bacterium]|nr:type I-E CRISPR-associated protein Cas7/Cse4/CasC [Anaerolineae bacterium]